MYKCKNNSEYMVTLNTIKYEKYYNKDLTGLFRNSFIMNQSVLVYSSSLLKTGDKLYFYLKY